MPHSTEDVRIWIVKKGLPMDLQNWSCLVPSGERLHNYGKSPCLMGKSTINTNLQ